MVAICLVPSLAIAGPLPTPDAEFPDLDMRSVRLGQQLFYDPILSGNRDVSCATCHHPRFGTSDGVSLGIGDGGIGLGPDRRFDPDNPPEQRIPRNAPALFNLGATEFTRFFHDGRLEQDNTRPSGIRTPLGGEMEKGFKSALAAQAMFPVLSGDEMAGHYSESDVAQAVRQGFLTGEGGAWAILTARVTAIPDYGLAFEGLKSSSDPVVFADIANVIADFIAFEWRADQSLFDLYLRGENTMPEQAIAGMELFYGKAECDTCHSGIFQTDQQYHAIAMPQIGPGKAARFERHNRDIGRMRVTGDPDDAYRFRTPSLRNVTETAPYGHSGAYRSLETVVRHHLDPVAALKAYDVSQAILPGQPFETDDALMTIPEEVAAIADANELAPVMLSDQEVQDILSFLAALSDPVAVVGRLGVPVTVPSGLPVDQ
ncbi:cytochrome-c peroxidase [Shimia gijangensis]